MTGPHERTRGAVRWLTAQSVVFGAVAALLGIVANALFLDAYGSAWLPATYIAIGAAGIVVSGAVARTAQRFDLLRIALVVLGGAAAGIAAGWVVARSGAAWVSVPLLVLFPILIQLGFVFIGGQAGRLLDIAGIKASFPRIVAGFPLGAVLGGLLGAQLVSWLGRTEDLLLATALFQAGFTGLVWVTGRRYAAQLGSPGTAPVGRSGKDDHPTPEVSLRALLATRFVALILAYQVLSAVGSQLADFLVYDRANAQYPEPADLARYLAGYTALMNAASIAFLFLLAGPLLRRFGLRLGIAANPLVLTVFAGGMIAVNVLTGGTSFALLAIVSAARIADIALTDGTTRTSINATYQVLPERTRLSVQAAVEGIGVPVAIGISGVLILVLNALPFALTATIVVTAITCAVWTWIGIVLYREYGPALVGALQRRQLLVPTAEIEASAEDEAIATGLLANPDPRSVRLGLDLVGATSSPVLIAELAGLSGDLRPEIRMPALARLAATGDESARRRLADDVRAGIESPDAAVRSAALDSVRAGDAFAIAPAIAALGDASTADAAAGAVGRLGDAAVPTLVELLDSADPHPPSLAMRLVRAVTASPSAREALGRHVAHRDRDLGLAVLERLVAPEPAPEDVAAALDGALSDDDRHATRIRAAMAAFGGAGGDPRDADEPLRRALLDELDLVRQRLRANRLARHGSARLGPVLVELGAGGPRGSLAAEALEVLLGNAESTLVLALLERDASVDAPGDPEEWLKDLVEDAEVEWRSPWLRACAIHAARARGLLDRLDLAAARALGDPVIDEILDRA